MRGIFSRLLGFFGAGHPYRRYGGIGGVAAGPIAYGLYRYLRGRRERALTSA